MAPIPGWQKALLGLLHAPATTENVRFLNAWQRAEGGSARYNPLNTTQGAPGATDYNSVHVRNYSSAQAGLNATVQTLLNGRYGGIVDQLRSGKASASALAQAVEHSPWGTGGGVLRVLGAGGAGLNDVGGGAIPAVEPATTQGGVPAAAAPDLTPYRSAAIQQLIGQVGQRKPDYSGFLDAGKQLRDVQQAPVPQPAARPGQAADLAVDVQHGAHVGRAATGAIALAKEYLGTDYHWGGASPKTGFDCSGLLQYAYAKQGVQIPRVTYDQWKAGRPVAKGQLHPGDAVFFHAGPRGPEHVGMYVGGGNFLEAPRTGLQVRISKLAGRSDFLGARRYA